ncbi:hypothetical protein I0D00_05425 [Pseudomonas lalucatii]|uniref:Uncharacterized protein n=1 Tax=Pseudomonas lalucatii TaxID=1424203 RepID=A0ABS5PY14_9PSED|nr:hypothetical protein [Pseudomonas lalucatii]MBS7661388.1 hypothetical protein [Pseudomonas lalucatii]MBS7724122.1 hypothetical protein [Pseudomonas lalucatii]QVM87878.1 hypothetical protein I0D68_02430 [Pseudomonas lalucatii]
MPQPDSQQHLAARLAILNHPDAQDCTVYRPDENDADAEEHDLGDAKVLFTGAFQAPQDWDAEQRDEYYGDSAPELFMTAALECEAKPGSAAHFTAEVGDYVACMPGLGEVVMFYVHDCQDGENGRSYVLLRDDEALD